MSATSVIMGHRKNAFQLNKFLLISEKLTFPKFSSPVSFLVVSRQIFSTQNFQDSLFDSEIVSAFVQSW